MRPLIRGRYTGIDERESRLRVARLALGHPGDRWICGRLRDLQLEDRAVDQVFWRGVLELLDDGPALELLEESLRVSGTNVLIAEPYRLDDEPRAARRSFGELRRLTEQVADPIAIEAYRCLRGHEVAMVLRPR